MRSRVQLLLAALVLAASACGVIREIFPSLGPKPRPFNHEAHIVRGLSCLDCHETAEKEVRAGMPGKAFCMNCHEDLDKEPGKPLDKKVAAFLDAEGNPVWSRFTAQSEDIRFSHKVHAEKKVACGACHAGIDKDTGLVPGLVQRMSSCTTCHDKVAPSKNDCATCHVRTDRLTPPANHRQLWMQMHGLCSRQGAAAATANDCSLCHRSDSCTTCHQTQPPRDHTDFWRLKAHGIAAGIDRSRCQTCHTSDGCNRCHVSATPSSRYRAGPLHQGAARSASGR